MKQREQESLFYRQQIQEFQYQAVGARVSTNS